jgi:iron complex outermembrane recepter protein
MMHVLALTAALALAQPPDEPKSLPKIQVEGQEDEGLSYVTPRSRVLRTETPLNEIPLSISVISAAQIDDQNAQTLQEVLRYTAGVRSDMYGLDNRGDWFTMRGGSEGSTLLNGLRLPLSGWWGVVRNEPYAFERIEVLRGPASVIAGQNGPGGVVNMVSKRPRRDAPRELELQLGNYNHKQLATDLGGSLNDTGTLLYNLVALVKDSDTQVDFAFDERQLIAPALTWRMSDATALTLYGEYQRDESGNTEGFFPWEGTLLPAPNGPIPSDTFVGEPDWDTYGGRRVRAGYELEHRVSDSWSVRHNLRQDRVTGELRTMYAAWWDGFLDASGAPAPEGRFLNRIWYANDDEGRITNGDLLAEGHLEFGDIRHTVLFGADFMTARNDNKSWEDAATPLDVYTPTYGSFPLPPLDDIPAISTRAKQYGVTLQDQMTVRERWVFVAGLRHDKAKNEIDGTTSSDDSAWSKNLGVVYLAGNGWSPYASYSESFEAVADADLGGNPFKPKRGKQVEAGVKFAPAERGFMATAAVYRLEEKNRLTTDPRDINFSIQLGKVQVEGLELEATAALSKWDLVANYTYTDARQVSASEEDIRYLNKQLHSIPEHSAALWAVHRFDLGGLAGFRAGAGVRYVGKTWDGTDSLATPSNTLIDAMASWEQGSWRYALNVSNLTDKTYIATCLERGDCWYGTRREIAATVGYRF